MMLVALLAGAVSDAQLRHQLAEAPPAIRLFQERRARCEHWEGEDPYDRERGREIVGALGELRCSRIGADERALRQRFRHRPDLLNLLTATRDWGE